MNHIILSLRRLLLRFWRHVSVSLQSRGLNRSLGSLVAENWKNLGGGCTPVRCSQSVLQAVL